MTRRSADPFLTQTRDSPLLKRLPRLYEIVRGGYQIFLVREPSIRQSDRQSSTVRPFVGSAIRGVTTLPELRLSTVPDFYSSPSISLFITSRSPSDFSLQEPRRVA